jgi:hypothetical protein
VGPSVHIEEPPVRSEEPSVPREEFREFPHPLGFADKEHYVNSLRDRAGQGFFRQSSHSPLAAMIEA